MNPTAQGPSIPPTPVYTAQSPNSDGELNLFAGVSGLTPRQMYLLKKNLDEQRKEKQVQDHDLIPEEYKYVFTRNYIIVSAVLIVVSFVVFGVILIVQITGFSTRGNSVLGVDTIQAKAPSSYAPES